MNGNMTRLRRKENLFLPYKEPENEMLQANDSSRVHGRTSREGT